jgi:hypothetical protein
MLLDFLFRSTDVRVFELVSKFDCELKEFLSTREIDEEYDLGTDLYGNQSTTLQLWSPSAMPHFEVRRINLLPRKCKGHTFRYEPCGWGLMQLYLGGVHNKKESVLTKTHFGHNSEIRATVWNNSDDTGVDWKILGKLSNKIQYFIRKNATMKVPGRPILPHAAKLVNEGQILKESVSCSWSYEVN